VRGGRGGINSFPPGEETNSLLYMPGRKRGKEVDNHLRKRIFNLRETEKSRSSNFVVGSLRKKRCPGLLREEKLRIEKFAALKRKNAHRTRTKKKSVKGFSKKRGDSSKKGVKKRPAPSASAKISSPDKKGGTEAV